MKYIAVMVIYAASTSSRPDADLLSQIICLPHWCCLVFPEAVLSAEAYAISLILQDLG